MFHKFKTTTYGTLLLIGVFVLPYAGNVADVNAENYGCKGSKKEVRQCLKAVITVRDEMIDQMDAGRERMETENQRLLVVEQEKRGEIDKLAESILGFMKQADDLKAENNEYRLDGIQRESQMIDCIERIIKVKEIIN